MSEPTPLKNLGGYYSTTWADPRKPGERRGRARMKRFGRVGKVTRTEANRRYRRWLDKEFPTLKLAGETAYSVDQLCHEYFEQMGKRYVVDGKHTTSITRIRIALDSFRAKYGERESDSITAGMTAAWLEGFIHERKTKAHRGTQVVSEDRRYASTGSVLPVRSHRADVHPQGGHSGSGDSGDYPKPRTKDTCNLALTYVKRMFRWGARFGKVSDAAAGAVQLAENLRSDHPELRKKDAILPVAWETVEATKELCPPLIANMIDVLWLTGMRPGEIRSMRPCDLTVSDGLRVYTPRRHKTSHKGKIRKIVLGPRAWRIIEPLLPSRTDAPVFPVNQSAGNLAVYIARRAKRAGVERWTLNMIRHSYATRVEDQFGAESVTATLGHANLNQQQVYVSRSLRRAMDVAREVG